MKYKSKVKSQKSKIKNKNDFKLKSGGYNLYCIVLLALLTFISGCATTGGPQEGGQGPQIAVITEINILDNQVNIVVDKPFTYTAYKSSDPYKVILEMPDVRLGVFTEKIKSDKAGITEITPSQTEEPIASRFEILLSSPMAIEPVYKDTSLTINIKEEPEAPKAEEGTAIPEKAGEPVKEVSWPEVAKPEGEKAAPPGEVKEEAPAPVTEQRAEVARPEEKAAGEKVSAPRETPAATSIVQVNIEKEEESLKVVIKGNGSMSPNVFRLDNRAVIDIPNVEMAASLPTPAPSPIKNIRAGKHKDKTRLVLDLKPRTSFDVAVIEDSILIVFQLPKKEKFVAKKAEKTTAVEPEPERKTAVVAPEKPVEGKYKGQKISLDFQDADIGPIFRLLADISGYNFVIDPAVKGRITMKLLNVPWDQALDIIIQTFSLGKSIDGNIIWIAPAATFAKMAKEKTDVKAAEEVAEELFQDIVRVNYATAGEISAAINQAKLLSTRGSVTMDSRMNTLIIKDTQRSIDRIKELVKIMDVSKPQVMIEAKIVEVSSNYSESLGIRWGGNFYTQTWPNTASGDFSVNTPIVAAGSSSTNPGGVLGLSIGHAKTINVNLSLSALESIGKSKRLSNPKILTIDNESANIQQGVSIPVQTVSAEGTRTEYVNATLSLNVTPRITPDGYIQLKITATNNALGILTPQGYAIETKSVQTQALIKSGDTLVIGGIYTTNISEGETGIPLLGRIPLLGWLFKTKTVTGPNITELLIFITPMVVSQPT